MSEEEITTPVANDGSTAAEEVVEATPAVEEPAVEETVEATVAGQTESEPVA